MRPITWCAASTTGAARRGKLWDDVMASALLGHIRFEMPTGRGRKARAVEQEVRSPRVVLPDHARAASLK